MSIRRQVLRGSAILATSSVLGQAMNFGRSVVIARAIGPESMGVAAMLVLTVYAIEAAGDLAADRLLVQDARQDTDELQEALTAMTFIRGLLAGAAMLLLAQPLSHLFGVPEASTSFAALALYPVLRGLLHLDVVRRQRDMRFGAAAKIEVGSQLCSLVAAVPFTIWLGDYRAAAAVLLVQALSATVLSHLLARHPYRMRLRRRLVPYILSFSWPLTINSILFFLIAQGDRVLLASASTTFSITAYPLAAIGAYTIAGNLAQLPAALLAKVTSPVMLPVLAASQGDPTLLIGRVRALSTLFASVASLAGALGVFAGPALILLCYGPQYELAAKVFVPLVVAQSLRIERIAPNLVSLAVGDTRSVLLSNVARLAGVVTTFVAIVMELPLLYVACGAIVGEFVAVSVAAYRIAKRLDARLMQIARPLLLASLAILMFLAIAAAIPPDAHWWRAVLAVASLAIVVPALPAWRSVIVGRSKEKAGPAVAQNEQPESTSM